MLYIGKAQEKARVQRTERRRRASTGATYAWLVDSTAMVNHYYFYVVDDDFGPLFLKFCSCGSHRRDERRLAGRRGAAVRGGGVREGGAAGVAAGQDGALSMLGR